MTALPEVRWDRMTALAIRAAAQDNTVIIIPPGAAASR